MADAKITELTALTDPAKEDLMVVVDDVAGTATTKKATLANLLSLIYPIGCVYTTTVSTNPGTLFGFGTWGAFGAGKVLVGLDSGDTSFDTVEETGGAKTVASSAQTFAGTSFSDIINHTHAVNITDNGHVHGEVAPLSASGGALKFGIDTNASGTQAAGLDTASATTGITATTSNPASGVASITPTGTNTPGAATSVVQPYIVVYLFKRTA
jgi:hypothetical protein